MTVDTGMDNGRLHQFSAGQTVVLARGFPFPRSRVRILRLLPPTDAGQPMYRIKADGEPFERLVPEGELYAVEPPH